MATTKPIVQILSRTNYETQNLVPLPNAYPLPPLAPFSIRIRTSIISLTANNLTYGRIGHLLSIWSIYPLPPSTPDQFSNPDEYGRIGAWGYATVLSSNNPEIEIGTRIFGVLPIGTLPVDLTVRYDEDVPNQLTEVSEHRKEVMELYNRYSILPRDVGEEEKGHDALFRIFFMTSYLINRFCFPWDAREFILPGSADDNWTVEKGTLDEKNVVLVFADSGKTALAFAWLLRHRPEGKRPGLIVGIGSGASRDFVRGSGLYDKVLTYNSDEGDLERNLGLVEGSKIVLVEFGSRGGAADRWEDQLRERYKNVVQLIVAGEVIVESPEKATERFKRRSERGAAVFNASIVGARVVKTLGGRKYSEELAEEWRDFKKSGLVKGLNMVWGRGMQDVGNGWERLCRGEVKANEGLVFALE